MATGNPDTLSTPTSLGVLPELLKLLGGTKETTNPGDTEALRSTFAGLQGQDYEAMLKAIFNKAGGQIPGLQVALSNAIGARSGGNSGMAATLQKLMQETTVNAQDQIAKLQAQNFQTQANIGANIAQTTQGTTKTTGANMGQAAQNLAILTALKQLGIADMLKSDSSSSSSQASAPALNYTPSVDLSPQASVMSATQSNPNINFNTVGDIANQVSSVYTPTADTYTPIAVEGGGFVPQVGDPGFEFADMSGFQQSYTPPTYDPAPVDVFESLDTTDYTDPYADYADGGIVRAGGSRRSSNPTVSKSAPQRMGVADTGLQQVNPAVVEAITQLTQAKAPTTTAQRAGGGNDLGNLNSGSNTSFGGTTSNGAAISRDMANKVKSVNTLMGITGNPAVPGTALGGMLGLATAENKEQALANMGMTVGNVIGNEVGVPGLGGIVGTAMNPTAANITNAAVGVLGGVPAAAINAGLGLFGNTSIGKLAFGSPQTVNPKNGEVTEATGGLFGGTAGVDFAAPSPVSPMGQVVATDLPTLSLSPTAAYTNEMQVADQAKAQAAADAALAAAINNTNGGFDAAGFQDAVNAGNNSRSFGGGGGGFGGSQGGGGFGGGGSGGSW